MLDKVLTTLEIPVNGQTRVPSVYAVRGDLKTRAVFCKLTNGEPSDCDSAEEIREYIISSGSTAVLKAVKPDGTKIFNTAVIRNGGVYVELTSQLLASEGTVKCEIYVYGAEDVITVGRFNVEVANQLFGDEGIESADEYSELQRIISTSDSKAAEASESASKAALSAANALLSSESAAAAEKNARSAEQGAKTAEQSTKEALTGYVKKTDIYDSNENISGDKLGNCVKYNYAAPTDGETAADFQGQLYLDQATHTVYMCEAVSTISGKKTGYFLKLPSNSDLEKCVKKTDYATVNTPGVVTLADSGNPGNNPAVMTEDAVEEYLGKNNYIKWQEVPGALTAGKYIDISSDGTITAKALNNYGSPSDMTDFSDSVLLTPQNMPEMTAITLVSSAFHELMTDARKDAVLATLGAAKESDVAYASQTAKGTIRAWLTTENGESVLNLATEDSE